MKYSLLRLPLLAFVIFLAGCGSNINNPLIDTESLSTWTLITGENISDDTVQNALSLIDSSATKNQSFLFHSVQDTQLTTRVSSGFDIESQFSHGYTDDKLVYNFSGESIVYSLPYSLANKNTLASPECQEETMFDTILCYMPRINGIYGPFDNVFAYGKQLVYTVSSYQGLNTQRILDLGTQYEFPQMDRLFLLYHTADFGRVIAAEKGDLSVYNNIMAFENVTKTSLKDGPVDALFYDGAYLYMVTTNNESGLSDLTIYDMLDDRTIASVSDLDIGEVAEFSLLDSDTLLINYVDVSFTQEQEFYYLLQYNLGTDTVDWKVQL